MWRRRSTTDVPQIAADCRCLCRQPRLRTSHEPPNCAVRGSIDRYGGEDHVVPLSGAQHGLIVLAHLHVDGRGPSHPHMSHLSMQNCAWMRSCSMSSWLSVQGTWPDWGIAVTPRRHPASTRAYSAPRPNCDLHDVRDRPAALLIAGREVARSLSTQAAAH
jgi:hypothetical protein